MSDGCRICGLEVEADGLCAGHREEWIRWAANRPEWHNEAGYEAWIGSRVYDMNAKPTDPGWKVAGVRVQEVGDTLGLAIGDELAQLGALDALSLSMALAGRAEAILRRIARDVATGAGFE